jgi:hypothetical protein
MEKSFCRVTRFRVSYHRCRSAFGEAQCAALRRVDRAHLRRSSAGRFHWFAYRSLASGEGSVVEVLRATSVIIDARS